ncbi:MAG TPA: thiamine-phosphate kinase, partial [Chitinophagales bacterium]|nr:thiamine-phosphate kinase [Chitinophagales bacterium]
MPTPISQYGEFGLIDHLTQNTQHYQHSTIKGIGDDCAVLNHEGKQTIVTTDLLLEGIHFDLMYTPLKHLGYKAVVVNLSDIYAMNATPQQITVSIGVSARFSVEALEALYDGIHTACKYYQVDLVGGDTSSSLTGLCISITAIGTADSQHIVYRNGAKVGDIVCVSGDLGAAFVGLQLLEREKKMYLENPNIQPDLEQQQYVVGRLLKPEARRDIIALLQSHQIQPTAMIDVSDGLSSELLHICRQSKVGCRIYENQLPMH